MGKLTARKVEAIKLPGRHPDGDELFVHVAEDGAKSWHVRYRVAGQRRWATIGSYPTMSLKEARVRGQRIRGEARRGVDLIEQERREASVAARPKTVTDLIERYIQEHVSGLRQQTQTEALLRQHVLPKLGKRAVVDVRRGDVVAMLDDLKGSGLTTQVNRVLTQTRAAWRWAIERELADSDPTLGVRRPVVEHTRERVLNDGEIAAVWRAAGDLGYPLGDIVKMLFCTAARKDEVREMKRQEVGEDGIWTLPANRNKAKREHRMPLPRQAKELLEKAPKRGEYVFSLTEGNPYAWRHSLKEDLDKLSGVTGWTIHDIRRTVRSKMAELGVREDVAEKAMNHSGGKLVRTYNRHDYGRDIGDALQQVADHVERLANTLIDDNVYLLSPKRA